jgi:hypothetical protein
MALAIGARRDGSRLILRLLIDRRERRRHRPGQGANCQIGGAHDASIDSPIDPAREPFADRRRKVKDRSACHPHFGPIPSPNFTFGASSFGFRRFVINTAMQPFAKKRNLE